MKMNCKNILYKSASVFGCACIIAPFTLHYSLDILFLSLLLILAYRLDAKELFLFFISLLLTLGLAEGMLRFLTKTDAVTTAYRMDDKYFGPGHYTPNVEDAMTMRFGDILAMDPLAPASIREARHVAFHTDDLGFRNDSDYHGQSMALVGDSFVAGTGTDQSALLGNVLRTEFGLDTYSLGFPGNPDDYLQYADRFLKEKSKEVRFALFVFEGNDLSCSSKQRKKFETADLPPYSAWKIRLAKAINGAIELPMTIINMSLQVWQKYSGNAYDLTDTYRIGAKDVGFYGPYTDAALFAHCSFTFSAPPPEALSRVAMVFFIPAKYRVYYDFIDAPDKPPLPRPASGFTDMQRYLDQWGIPAYDLTPALTEAAGRLLPEGGYVFWRDDTHWGPAGIRAAAAVVAQKLREYEADRPAPKHP
ncbi:alginate O-acetyltransferase AlgX-related protein [Desulfovibrio sp. TomC]|uniref:alginate O-acetyltransferase AlgX-related protein n=1 Tax=Desulfovibrio sp. TomC TaxID=1562888 RepID=UPI0005759AEF|nr:hypothetical protein [Desulfovibrio sp. TomC]KHK03450.1 hypothetical protein NY78_1035 [Desulfovibrio sp. TomC]